MLLLLIILLPFIFMGITHYFMISRLNDLQKKVKKIRKEFIIHSMEKPFAQQGQSAVIIGSAVVSPDPLTLFFSKWRHFFGGQMQSLTKFMERARLEAEIRMLKQAKQQGFKEIACIRYATSDLGGKSSSQSQGFTAGEFLCYATGIK